MLPRGDSSSSIPWLEGLGRLLHSLGMRNLCLHGTMASPGSPSTEPAASAHTLLSLFSPFSLQDPIWGWQKPCARGAWVDQKAAGAAGGQAQAHLSHSQTSSPSQTGLNPTTPWTEGVHLSAFREEAQAVSSQLHHCWVLWWL